MTAFLDYADPTFLANYGLLGRLPPPPVPSPADPVEPILTAMVRVVAVGWDTTDWEWFCGKCPLVRWAEGREPSKLRAVERGMAHIRLFHPGEAHREPLIVGAT